MPRLIMEREDGHTHQYEVDGEMTIGRSSDNTIRVPTSKASRRHCRIFADGGNFFVEDLGSSNGTKCNGKKFKGKVLLQNKDVISIGGITFTFLEEVDDPLVGSRLGKYHIIEPLGKGGMGVVYRAKQVTLGRDVALKVLNPTLVKKEGFVDSFRKEAKLAASLQHPNIISIHDFGQEGDWYYFSMELVDGENLLDRMSRQGALTPEELVVFGKQVCEALEHAHGKNILHQDIKPQNLMIDKDGNIKVADLGLANVMQYGKQADKERVSMGTPQYVAPEVIRRRPADARSDIYSLSATLYYLCTGKIPFEAKTLKEMLQMHLNATVPDPRDLMPIPDALAELIMRGLSKDPARRPEDIKAYAKALARSVRQVESTPVAAAAPVRKMPKPTKVISPKATSVDNDDPLSEPRTTRREPKKKSYVPLAIGGGILLVVVIAGYFVMNALTAGQEADAQRYLSSAKIMIKQQSYGEAREMLQKIILNYQGTEAAREAGEYLAQVEKTIREVNEMSDREFERIQARYQDGTLDLEGARRSLINLASNPRTKPEIERQIRAYLKRIIDEDQAKQEAANDPALAQWEVVDGVVTRFVDQGRFGDARELIQSFRKKNPGSAADEMALKRLEALQGILTERGKTVFDEAMLALRDGDLGKARSLFVKIEDDLPGTEWAEKASEERSTLDREARTRFFSGWDDVFLAARQLDIKAASAAGTSLRDDLAPTAWGKVAEEVASLSDTVGLFYEGVTGAVARGAAADQERRVSVIDMGLVTLEFSEKDGLIAVGKDGQKKPITLYQIALLDMMKLVPREDLTEQQALGASLYFLGRGHKGLMKGYLERLSPDGINAPLRRQMLANLEGRASVEYFDFEGGLSANSRWRPLADSSEWVFEDGTFGAPVAGRAMARLTGRRFRLGDVAVSFDAFRDDLQGQAGAVFVRDEDNFIAVSLLGEKATIQLTRDGVAQSAEAPFGEGRWRLSIKDGTAKLYRAGEAVAELDVSGTEVWEAELRLELNATSGYFDHVEVEEGLGAGQG